MEKTNNIVDFPQNRIVRTQSNDAELMRKRSVGAMADALAGDICIKILFDLDNCGYDLSDENFNKYFGKTMEMFRATVYQLNGLEHDYHKLLDDDELIPKLFNVSVSGQPKEE